MPGPRPDDASSSRSEKLCLGGLLLVVLLVNLLTGDRCPTVWVDEAAYTDPAWNLHLGRGFTSSAWYAQGENEFWAGNVPLYPAVLYAWAGWFGFGILSVRALNYVLISVSAVLLWLAVKRLRLIERASYRIALVAMVLLGFGVCFSYRSGRPDTLCILLASAAAWAYSIENRATRLTVLGTLGILFPIAGLQLVVFAGLLCLFLLPFLRSKYLAEAVVLGAGCVLGGMLLFAWYSYHGVWNAFLLSTAGTHSAAAGEGLLGKLSRLRIPGGLKDPSYLLLLLIVVGIAMWAGVRRRFNWRSPLGFAVVAGLGMPWVLYAVRGQYPCYYSWMAYIPLCICLCSVLGAPETILPLRRVTAGALLCPICLVGLPLVTGLSVLEWSDRDYTRVENFVAGKVQAEDRVYCDGAAYYALKTRSLVETGRHHLQGMTPREKARISTLVINPKKLAEVQAILGGRWRPCGEVLRPARGPLLGVRSEYFLDRYTLQVFRRGACTTAKPCNTRHVQRKRTVR